MPVHDTHNRRRCLTSALVIAALVAQPAAPAFAADKAAVAACVKASEDGQSQRDDGKLIDAKESFIKCSDESCPGVVRKECSKWLTDVEGRIPEVIPVLKDENGQDVLKATLSIDGKEVASSLDGKAIPVDPGQHTFRFAVKGKPPVEIKAVVREDEQHRTIEAALASKKPKKDAAPADKEQSSGAPVLGYVLAGVGIVGLGSFGYFGYSGVQKKNNLAETCAPNCQQSDVDAVKQKLLIADVSLAVGLVALGVGAYLILTNDSSTRKKLDVVSRSRLVLGPTGAGFSF